MKVEQPQIVFPAEPGWLISSFLPLNTNNPDADMEGDITELTLEQTHELLKQARGSVPPAVILVRQWWDKTMDELGEEINDARRALLHEMLETHCSKTPAFVRQLTTGSPDPEAVRDRARAQLRTMLQQ